ncbi:MAG: putative PIN and TRAM-domain containing protein precursor [Firmicutes bacterium ADurb.Bin248]|mgnify:FL=1|nr:MAG: putative PIN and TRAM-domain containing protein precursor [Firmicutes bacterium ADurb.Bin248]HOG00197.1 PIN/TRAM domain-containing protein [Clostridia bacterium]
MAKKIARAILALVGAGLGVAVVEGVNELLIYFWNFNMHRKLIEWGLALIYIGAAVLFAILLYLLAPRLIEGFTRFINTVESRLADMSMAEIFFGVVGLIVGLVIAFLMSTLTAKMELNWLAFIINAILYFTFGYLGWTVVTKRKGEINTPSWFKRGAKEKAGKTSVMARPKILDTSVIIDGRVTDICRTGILEGNMIVPSFVLRELRHIADSADPLKRNRGRRGLDILNTMQEELEVPIKVVETDYEDIAEVDAKLIRLAYDMGGVVVTNDYNLNKVAGVQRVPVLNINELANAIKPVLLPGEEMTVSIMKEGKEAGQGVAYLADGTMIVVDGGRRFLGEEAAVVVTSALQTSAGRMIFAKLKDR